MITAEQLHSILKIPSFLQSASQELVRDFAHAASLVQLPAKKVIFTEGDQVTAIALLIAGVVRVYKKSESGREITLYRFSKGEACILTANAILNQQTFPANAIVEMPIQAVQIPAETFRTWVHRYDLWRNFVFTMLSQRLTTMLAVVDEIAFHRMDQRIATRLLNYSRLQNPVRITHQEIAAELGSTREVISRILEDFASQGFIRATRGAIEILDSQSLQLRCGTVVPYPG